MTSLTEVTIPDIGEFENVEVIEVLVVPGELIQKEDTLITLESDKAIMEVPAPYSGTVIEIRATIGDRVSKGTLIALIDKEAKIEKDEAEDKNIKSSDSSGGFISNESVAPLTTEEHTVSQLEVLPHQHDNAPSHASPAVRRFGRTLGGDRTMVKKTGNKGRIIKSDVQNFVKNQLVENSQNTPPVSTSRPQLLELDFSKWGPTKTEPLSRIQKRSGPRLLNSWRTVPHVNHHEEVDITDLENFRQSYKHDANDNSSQITLLPFLMKAVTGSLIQFPRLNSSLAPNQTDLILKNYFHIGVAVDTTNGLIVPIIKHVNDKGIFQLDTELKEAASRARGGKIKPEELQGGCFTISNLGGIGGRGFTPIVNIPEVAILGVSRTATLPQWDGNEFIPRLMLPLDLSYDHRVIDGATAARFLSFLKTQLEDIRLLLL